MSTAISTGGYPSSSLLTTTISVARPQMPTQDDELRCQKQAARWFILTEDFEELLSQWMVTRVDEQRLAAWGPPDTSSNVLSDMCRQFSTPGLYGTRPSVFHADVTNQGLVGPGGYMDRSGYWTMMQVVQYFTIGMGDFLVRADADASGLSFRLVRPQDVWIYASTDRPDVPLILWELRLRHVKWPTEEVGRWVYAWDQYDLGEIAADGTLIREPSYRVVQATGIERGMDLSSLFIGKAYVGADYRYRHADGRPFLPFPIYRAVDGKQPWNHLHKVGATRGTLNAATHWTYAGHCARDASGKAVLVSGLMPIMGDAQNAGEAGAIRSIQISPGALMYHAPMEGAQPFVQEIGPGGNLNEVAQFAHFYESKQMARWGISADDVTKSGSDPASGAALFISRQSKREYAAQVKPLFERADLDAIRICAALLRLAEVETFAETGYSISYSEIPRSPAEEKAMRDEIDWDLEHGHISEVDAYLRRHPGAREEDAMAAITKAAVDRAKLEQARAVALVDAGLVPVPPTTDAPADAVAPAASPIVPVEPPPGGERVKIDLTSTDIASIVTVDEARASQGLPPLGGADGALTVAEYQAKNAAVIAAAASATAGDAAPEPTPDPAPEVSP